MTASPQSIGILLFDDVELLDFAGPMQVFTSAQYLDPSLIQIIETVGVTRDIKVSKTSMKIEVERLLEEKPKYDLIIIPGGFGTRPIMKNNSLLAQIDQLIGNSQFCMTVCTGSLILAKLGRLSGLKATTHIGALDLMRDIDSSINIDRSLRYHYLSSLLITEGVSAGIDGAFYLLSKLYSEELAKRVRDYIEYYPEKS